MVRERRYLVATVVAYAKKRFEEAAAVAAHAAAGPVPKAHRHADQHPLANPMKTEKRPRTQAADAPYFSTSASNNRGGQYS